MQIIQKFGCYMLPYVLDLNAVKFIIESAPITSRLLVVVQRGNPTQPTVLHADTTRDLLALIYSMHAPRTEYSVWFCPKHSSGRLRLSREYAHDRDVEFRRGISH